MKIVHIEDNSLDAELIRLAVDAVSENCEIKRVTTQKEFETEIEKSTPDMILSDSKLPGFDTSMALSLMRQRHPTTPFIYVTGNSNPAAKQRAIEQGATDFISKDNLAALANVVRNVQRCQAPGFSSPRPEIDKMVVACCAEFRCLAYMGSDGKWRDYLYFKELPEVIEWFEP